MKQGYYLLSIFITILSFSIIPVHAETILNDETFGNPYVVLHTVFSITDLAYLSANNKFTNANNSFVGTVYAQNFCFLNTTCIGASGVVESDPVWTADKPNYYTITQIDSFIFPLFNKTYADTLYAPIGAGADNTSWNQSYANTLYAPISTVGDNRSWNESRGYAIFLNRSSESSYLSTYNATYAALVTDNQSWNKTYADSLYVNVVGDTMTGNLNMQHNNITSVNMLAFNVTGCPTTIDTTLTGYMCWDTAKSTLNIVTGLGNIIQVAQEQFKVVKNLAGRQVLAGEILSITGASGEIPTAVLANASQNGNIHDISIVTVPTCNNNAACIVTILGEVHDLNTSAYSEGDAIYLSASVNGGITKTAPGYPNYNRHLGIVLKVHETSGIIDFRPEVDYNNGITINQLGVITNVTIGNSLCLNGTCYSSWSFAGNASFNQTFTNSLYIKKGGDNVTGNYNITGNIYAQGFCYQNGTCISATGGAETDPIYTADKPSIALRTEVVNNATATLTSAYLNDTFNHTNIVNNITILINTSWNAANGFTLFLNRSSESFYLSTYNATYDAKISYNTSWDEAKANTLYYKKANDIIMTGEVLKGASLINTTQINSTKYYSPYGIAISFNSTNICIGGEC